MENNNYDLLRPFDLEAAKNGEAICATTGICIGNYVAGPDKDNVICFITNGVFRCWRTDSIRMAPFAWIEGKPVYKGDVLYGKHTGKRYLADGTESATWATWQLPEIKHEGWINVYPQAFMGFAANINGAYLSRRDADLNAQSNRLACLRIEWEE